jgi:hypothetical protein
LEAGAPASIPEEIQSGVSFARVVTASQDLRSPCKMRGKTPSCVCYTFLHMFEAIQPSLPILVIAILFVIIASVVKALTSKTGSEKFPYKSKPSVMTPAEQKYFRKLEQQFGNSNYIFCQVALDRIINTTDQKNFYTYWNKINKKSIDFVLVNKKTLQTVKLIELNDSTHKSSKRRQRDTFLKQVCEAAGIELEVVS